MLNWSRNSQSHNGYSFSILDSWVRTTRMSRLSFSLQSNDCEQRRTMESSGEYRRGARRWPEISKNRRSSTAASGRQRRVRGKSGVAGWLSVRWNAVVEHKGQTHNGGFALISRYFRASYRAARVYFKGSKCGTMKINQPGREKAQEGSFRGGAGSMRHYQAL